MESFKKIKDETTAQKNTKLKFTILVELLLSWDVNRENKSEKCTALLGTEMAEAYLSQHSAGAEREEEEAGSSPGSRSCYQAREQTWCHCVSAFFSTVTASHFLIWLNILRGRKREKKCDPLTHPLTLADNSFGCDATSCVPVATSLTAPLHRYTHIPAR